MQLRAEHYIMTGGISAFLFAFYWVRRRELRVKYALTWLGIGSFLLISGLFPSIIMDTANRLNFSYAGFVSFVTAALLFFFAFSVSISLSRQYRRNIRLTQEIAMIEQRIGLLEKRHYGESSGQTLLKQTEDELASVSVPRKTTVSSYPVKDSQSLRKNLNESSTDKPAPLARFRARQEI